MFSRSFIGFSFDTIVSLCFRTRYAVRGCGIVVVIPVELRLGSASRVHARMSLVVYAWHAWCLRAQVLPALRGLVGQGDSMYA
jgi:hypothetical protein